mmetsp:Transcript_62820/g.149651  ORF Transcript_62820/g.149651 Transcript_62820/m.149651 type:complete len:253 (-) Transcript_62820:51-809(-)
MADGELPAADHGKLLALLHHPPLDVEGLFGGAGHDALEAHHAREAHQVVRHVVLAVADEGELHVGIACRAVLHDRQKVREHLARVSVVVESVDDGDRRLLAELVHSHAGVDAGGHDIDVARDHAGRVEDRLLLPEGGVVQVVEDRVPAELHHAGLEGHAGAERGLLEKREEGAPLERGGERVRVLLHGLGEVRDFEDLFLGKRPESANLDRVLANLGAVPEGLRRGRLEGGESRGGGRSAAERAGAPHEKVP